MRDTRDLRTFLVGALQDVASGTLDVGRAKAICGISQQIYNSLAVEMRAARVHAADGVTVISPLRLIENGTRVDHQRSNSKRTRAKV